MIGLVVAHFSDKQVADAATIVLLPLSGVLFGLAFSWIGTAHALLESPEIEELARWQSNGAGVEEYGYVYQLAVLVFVSCLVAWGLAALDVFPRPNDSSLKDRIHTLEVGLYALTSLAVRECWSVMNSVQFFFSHRALARRLAREIQREKEIANSSEDTE